MSIITDWVGWNALLWAATLISISGLSIASFSFVILAYAIWTLTILSIVAYIIILQAIHHNVESIMEAARESYNGRPVPTIVDVILDSCLVAVLIGSGHWFYGLLFTIHVIVYSYLTYKVSTETIAAS